MGWNISFNLKSKEKSLYFYRYNLTKLPKTRSSLPAARVDGTTLVPLGDEGVELGWAMAWEGLGIENVCGLCRRVPSRPFTELGWPSSGLNLPKCHLQEQAGDLVGSPNKMHS